MANVIRKVEQCTKIVCDGVEYEIIYYLGGDYKFLLEVSGLQCANSGHSCVYCNKSKKLYHDTKIKGVPRTIASIKECAKKQDKAKKFSCTHDPLFASISPERAVIDSLHMFLRLSDRLFNHHLKDCESADKEKQR